MSGGERAVRHRATIACALVAASTCGACAAERKLVILSDPPGALLRLDDTIVGTTPYEVKFDAYGTRRITLYREGYRPRSEQVEIDPPWYAVFPLDIFSEVLFPIGWKDVRAIPFVLEPESGAVTMPDLTRVLARAESLRLAEPSGPRPTLRAEPLKPAPVVEPEANPK